MALRTIAATALVAGLLVGAPAFGATPTTAERKMIAAVDADSDRNVRFLEQLVLVNSGTMNLKGVEQVGRLLRPEFEALGFQVRWVPMTHTGRAGHMIATHKGSGRGKRILLIGHLDTVFEPDSPFQGWKRTGDIVEGPGVSDMKGGNVIILAAFTANTAALTAVGSGTSIKGIDDLRGLRVGAYLPEGAPSPVQGLLEEHSITAVPVPW